MHLTDSAEVLILRLTIFVTYNLLLKKKAVTAVSFLNFGMKSLDRKITAFPLTLKPVRL